jgi:formylglycine-generating enzyme required for sulfatase activity
MNRHLLRRLGFVLFAALQLLSAAAEPPQVATQFDFSSETTPGARKFYFATIPGHRYTLQRSTDLQTWTDVAGYPQTATGLSIGHTFSQGVKEYFRIQPIDDQPPVIEDQFPAVDAFAVRRFSDLHFLLSDATGIDPASISLTIGNGAALTMGAPGLTLVGNTLTYTNGSTALGAYGATVPVTLTVADTLGHSLSHTFSFTLEVQPIVVSNLYVFGSPAAQRAGQQIAATPTAALAKISGPVAMAAADPWSISSVLADRVILAYTGASAPVFAPGTYLANLTPVKLSDIFYRKILSVGDAPATKMLTLMTADVPLTDILQEGTATLSADSMIYGMDGSGTLQPASQFTYNRLFPRMGINRDGAGPLALPGNPKFNVSLPEAHVWFTPTLDISLEAKYFSLQRASIKASGDIEAALVPEMTYNLYGVDQTAEWAMHPPVIYTAFLGWCGPLPIWLSTTYTTTLKFNAASSAALKLDAGWRWSCSVSAGATYTKDNTPKVEWTRGLTVSPLVEVPLTLSLGGTATATVSLVPKFDVRLFSLLGFYVDADPRVEAQATASGSLAFSPQNGSFQMASGATATLSGGMYADLNAGLSVIGVADSDLPAMDPFSLYTRDWGTLTFPTATALTFSQPAAPQAVSVALGGNLNLAGQAQGGSGIVSYQWKFNGVLIPGQTDRQLTIANVTAGNAGTYTLTARVGTAVVTSPAFTVSISNNAGTPADGFALIPAGSFQMGDQSSPREGYLWERPVHTVQVSAYYMAKYLVTKSDWDAVRAWGLTHGYTDLAVGNGKGANHPVQTITWCDMVKWCNARSEKEGLAACYTVSGAVYRTGSSSPVCNWNANGYRLPTEAEWEKAARGGLTAQNFPWGNTISHANANFCNNGGESYQTGATGYDPIWDTGATPYTSPVGSFAPNGYGLYDMAGNVWEWCWDYWGAYSAGSQTDPRGPASGADRVFRGGSCYINATGCRVAYRYVNDLFYSYDTVGFRVARSSVP